MMAYDANLEDGTLPVVIFAGSSKGAAALFCDHHVSVRGTMPGAFYVTRRTIAQEADPAALRAALRRDLAGLGIEQGGGWEIVAVATAERDAVVDASQAPTYFEPMTERKKRTALPDTSDTPVPTPKKVIARLYRDFPGDMAQLAAAERAEAELEQPPGKPH